MTGRSTLVLGLMVAALSGGCGTMGNLKRPTYAPADAPSAPVCRVYGGVRTDFVTMSEYQWNPVVTYLDYVAIPVLAAGSLTATFVGDTITLPYTLVAEARRAMGSPPAESPTSTVADGSSPAGR